MLKNIKKIFFATVFVGIMISLNSFNTNAQEITIMSNECIDDYEEEAVETIFNVSGQIATYTTYDIDDFNNFISIVKLPKSLTLTNENKVSNADIAVINSDNELIGLIDYNNNDSIIKISDIVKEIIDISDNDSSINLRGYADIFNKLAQSEGFSSKMIDSGLSYEIVKVATEEVLGTPISSFVTGVSKDIIKGKGLHNAIIILKERTNEYYDNLGKIFTENTIDAVADVSGDIVEEIVSIGFANVGMDNAVTHQCAIILGKAAEKTVSIALNRIDDRYDISVINLMSCHSFAMHACHTPVHLCVIGT